MKHKNRPDRLLFVIVVILLMVGFFIFTSAAFGLLARSGAGFQFVILKQLIIGVVMGTVALFAISKMPYKYWQKWALPLFLCSVLVSAILFIPGVGFSSGGAMRWIAVGPITFQPSEFLKLGTVLALAWWYSRYQDRAHTFQYGLLPFCGVLAIATLLVLTQPDTGTFLVIFASSIGIFAIAGASWKHIGVLLSAAILGVVLLASFRPYVRERLLTFMDPGRDQLGASYQLRQSILAIGSGGVVGRGFGQSVQKFNYLPEAIGDSIFAVAAEEFGFVGSSLLILLFLGFGLRGMKIAADAPNSFGRLTVAGIVILITGQSFINIGAMLGIIPLTGVPLLFVSHGGTALVFTLVEVGIILNVSRHRVTT
ncbi:MAG: stage V sporulation protein E [Candidatus Vogelbacteria bacterium CG10_big_fil_rev_8_21_14_0_10_51_16]|uniref:Probable peptidoglycan glycosyltransferase FtsW n=1 Tax=Candidatus Vogelbacteria bacterium CG10_big_fil_rev_8_21_14_0_10_51_16 TaxID=1975045 RepID=A0A2H0RE97_9BACT|nr:MAG: stage V sporulation protein E [Candidatus Vogelbacteria bacterium CG10_big_fil_rev_8_21_14_0_10_51_16]